MIGKIGSDKILR